MLYVEEDLIVSPPDTERYLSWFEQAVLPGARRRGLALVGCWHTPADIGEDVRIVVLWSVRDWGHWDEARRQLMSDPGMPQMVKEARTLRKGGMRKFLLPAKLSPLQ